MILSFWLAQDGEPINGNLRKVNIKTQVVATYNKSQGRKKQKWQPMKCQTYSSNMKSNKKIASRWPKILYIYDMSKVVYSSEIYYSDSLTWICMQQGYICHKKQDNSKVVSQSSACKLIHLLTNNYFISLCSMQGIEETEKEPHDHPSYPIQVASM